MNPLEKALTQEKPSRQDNQPKRQAKFTANLDNHYPDLFDKYALTVRQNVPALNKGAKAAMLKYFLDKLEDDAVMRNQMIADLQQEYAK